MQNMIAFPGLGIGIMRITDSFRVFGFTIHWYGVIIACGIALAYLFVIREAERREIAQDTVLDLVIYGLPSAIVCARLYYVIFRWSEYQHHLVDVVKIWKGGLAIYGGVIGGVLCACLYCRKKKLSFPKIADLGGFGFVIGQAVGRWGNFVNAEAYGAETTLPWRMQLVDLGICVHPTFLYESLWNLCLFLFLLFYRKKQRFDGEIFLLYLSGYGLGRLWIEGLRTDSLFLGSFRVSQMLAGLCFLVGLALVLYFRKKTEKI